MDAAAETVSVIIAATIIPCIADLARRHGATDVRRARDAAVAHPVVLLAVAYRAEYTNQLTVAH